jgi:hypothetical protein
VSGEAVSSGKKEWTAYMVVDLSFMSVALPSTELEAVIFEANDEVLVPEVIESEELPLSSSS